MPVDLIINLIFVLLLALLLWLFYAQNKSNAEQMAGCMRMLDEQIKALYNLEKRVQALENQAPAEHKILDAAMQNCEILINSMMDERIDELRTGNYRLAADIDSYAGYASELDERIGRLEEQRAPAATQLDDRGQILAMAASGLSAEQIAARLQKSPQAINIVLKSAQN